MERFVFEDASLDPWVYKFVLTTVLVALLANCIRLALSLHSYREVIFPDGGTLIAIPFLASMSLLLWQKPQLLRRAVIIIFLSLILRITANLIYDLFVPQPQFDLQLLWLSALMLLTYIAPFVVFRRKVACVLALVMLGLWMVLTGLYMTIYWQTVPMRETLVVLSQVYGIHCIVIIFMALFVRLRRLYLRSQKSVSHMAMLAHTDVLLGTPNRRSIQVQLEKRVENAAARPFSIVLIDIDHFKEINDRHGHNTGDEVLVEVANLISRYSRSVDDFGRWGGEEFVVILPDCAAMDAYRFAERIRASMETYAFRVGQVTASFGVAEFQWGDNLNLLLKRVDDALYKSKKLGRNRVELTT
ncbi:diguanylate cyclase [Alicyclobacillus sp. SO9]|uniref:GGDEF domain-containing protein n=1 Tax=Alicyclobacillus sp. SO9 TaxID=2665646 RepID=UPI0018E761B9|nr:GGDEF domain-containing protein [Alicyclobacillus sp. SO9]QQE77243.1 GGDEF domain-containing protein [Alicyclobacillus sp. SO9]